MSGTVRAQWDHATLEVDVEIRPMSGRGVVEISTGDIISLVAAMTDTERKMLHAALKL